jgi:hypothetical protein
MLGRLRYLIRENGSGKQKNSLVDKFANLFTSYKEKDFVKIKTNLSKKPLLAFDKDGRVKIFTMRWEYKLYEISLEKQEFIEIEGKNINQNN